MINITNVEEYIKFHDRLEEDLHELGKDTGPGDYLRSVDSIEFHLEKCNSTGVNMVYVLFSQNYYGDRDSCSETYSFDRLCEDREGYLKEIRSLYKSRKKL